MLLQKAIKPSYNNYLGNKNFSLIIFLALLLKNISGDTIQEISGSFTFMT